MPITVNIRKLPMFQNVDRMEDALHDRQDVIHPVADSPTRFEIMRETIKRAGSGPPK